MSILYQKKRVRYILNQLDGAGGYSIETDRQDLSKCDNCFGEINPFDFFFCRTKEKILCRKCVLNKHVMIFEEEHIDWHIIKVEKKEGQCQEEKEYTAEYAEKK